MAGTLPHISTSLRDRLGRALRDLRISVIDQCNLRCTYCMPEETYHEHYRFLEADARLTFPETERLARLFVELGARKLRLTGGEPLLRRNLPELVARLDGIDGVEDIALTTNGLLLARHAEALATAGLHRVTVSLDALDDDAFGRMNGRGVGSGRVLEGIEAALAKGLAPVKINVVVQRGVNDDQVVPLVAYFRDKACIVRFIEYMDVGTCNGWKRDAVVPSAELVARIAERFAIEPLPAGYHGEVATRFGFRDAPGEIGVISSVTQPFCGDCTRARLSADGRLYTCLFAGEGIDLRGPMRAGASDGDVLRLIADTWRRREDRYSELRAERSRNGSAARRVEMFEIGG